MKYINKNYLALAALVFSTEFSLANIMSSEERKEKMAAIDALLSNQVEVIDESLVQVAPSPFIPSLGHVEKVEVVVEEEIQLTDEQLLLALSEYIKPTGIFMFGGEFYLIFKEKKLKNGSEFGITYDDKEYSVEIIEITGSTYRIRRGDTELQMKLK